MMRTLREPQAWLALVISLALVAAVSIAGSLVTLPQIPSWYAALAKPSFNPPAWLFAPVWTTLYVMMAVAAWRVWLVGDPRGRSALGWYAVQLAFNAAWSQIFFGLQRPGVALLVILALCATLAAAVRRFWLIDRFAGWLLAPYLAWVAFATVLNGAIARLN